MNTSLPNGFTRCAGEGGRCNFSGTRDVAYGAAGGFNYRYGVTSGIDCSNNVFGDPRKGADKSCYMKDSGATTSSSLAVGYRRCAREDERCNFSGTKDVAYGGDGGFVYRPGVTGGIDCNNKVFGDPRKGADKSCYIKDTAAPAATLLGADPLGADLLGVSWNVQDVGWGSPGVWTRRGNSNTFDANWNGLVAVNTIIIISNNVSVHRIESADGNRCVYTGTLAWDRVTVTGKYSCTNGARDFDWRATIQH